MLAKLLNRMNLERLIYEELSDQYFQIEKKLAQKKGIEKQIEEVKKASEEQVSLYLLSSTYHAF